MLWEEILSKGKNREQIRVLDALTCVFVVRDINAITDGKFYFLLSKEFFKFYGNTICRGTNVLDKPGIQFHKSGTIFVFWKLR